MSAPRRLLIVGDPTPTHVGAHLLEAARTLGIEARLADVRVAFAGPAWRRRLAWWAFGHRPVRLAAFGRSVVREARTFEADTILATGLAPLDDASLAELGAMGVRRANFLTDDPWNPAHRAPWFARALPRYDHVFSPRRANLDQLCHEGIRRVSYLPFGFSPTAHRIEAPATEEERRQLETDVLLAGGADSERVAMLTPLVQSGLRVALHGGYWDRYPQTRPYARGFLDAAGLRRATASACVCLGLVRRANRDGHSMRTFEIPASGGCLLADRTDDHVALFGPEGECVMYFDEAADLVGKARWLVERPDERQRLARAAHARITGGGHTYADRLAVILDATA